MNYRKKGRNKSKQQRKHAKKRFAERVGINLHQDLFSKFVKMIQHHEAGARFIKKQSNRVSLWGIKIKEKEYRVVYDKIRKNIVTLLPN